MLYSPSTNGFYNPDINPDIPADARPVSSAQYKAALAAQTLGKQIRPGADGLPVALDPPAPSLEAQLAQLRLRRDRLLRESDFTQIPDAPLSADARAAWAAYRQALRDLPEIYADDPASAIWPTLPD